MKGYKNYSNKKIIILFYILAAIRIIDLIFEKFSYLSIGILIFVVLNIILISVNIKETYLIDDKKIIRRKLFKKIIKWEDIKEVTITNWYIKIIAVDWTNYKIIKKKNYYELFEEIKMEILDRTADDKVVFKPSINLETLKGEGGMQLLTAHIILNAVLIIAVPFFVMEIVASYSLFDTLTNIVSIFIYMSIAIMFIVLAVKISKNQRKTIALIKRFYWGYIILMGLYLVLELVKSGNEFNFLAIEGVLSSILFSCIIAFIVKEYLETSNRVKYYFVK